MNELIDFFYYFLISALAGIFIYLLSGGRTKKEKINFPDFVTHIIDTGKEHLYAVKLSDDKEILKGVIFESGNPTYFFGGMVSIFNGGVNAENFTIHFGYKLMTVEEFQNDYMR